MPKETHGFRRSAGNSFIRVRPLSIIGLAEGKAHPPGKSPQPENIPDFIGFFLVATNLHLRDIPLILDFDSKRFG
jgi:hypothetical protein